MSGLKNYLRIGTLVLCGLSPWAIAAEGYAQGTAWAPSRNATRPNAGATYSAEPSTPEWQRTPSREPVHTASHFAPRYSNTPSSTRTSHDDVGYRHSGSYSSGSHSSSRGNTQRLNYDVQLNPGERLVGQPTYSEPHASGAPSRSVRFAADETQKGSSEFLPTPDGVSSEPMLPRTMTQGEPHAHADEEVHFEPGFSYEDGNYGNTMYDGNGNCDSCTGGNCDSCTGGCFGSCQRDEWADPTRCSNCGCYGYHRIGCGRVAMCLHNCLGPVIREWSVFAGSQGFKGPLDGGANGNFGFNEGFNLAGPIIPWPRIGLGYQIGGRFAQSNLSGSMLNTSARDQQFVTAGFFHRAYRGCGLQWGVVYDWLSDNYFNDNTYAQVRTEISYLAFCGHEIGFLGMFGVKNTNDNQLVPVTQADQYNLFYRYTTEYGAQGRAWLGATGHSLTIIGADFRVPMSNRFDLVGGFNYIVPNDSSPANNVMQGGFTQESWGLSMNLVWYVGRRKEGVHNTPFRPLFNVADNNVMMFERQ